MKISARSPVPAVLVLAAGLCGHSYGLGPLIHYARQQRPGSSRAASTAQRSQATSNAGEIQVYLDGQAISTQSGIVQAAENRPGTLAMLSPIVVEGHVMIPVRFVKERLDDAAWIDKKWGIIQLGPPALLLKIGEKEAHCKALDFGVDGLTQVVIRLPLAPQVIHGRLYMPVEPAVFDRMGYTVEWDSKGRALRFAHEH